VTNPLPDWYVKEYPHAIRPDGQQPRRAGASLFYSEQRIEHGSSCGVTFPDFDSFAVHVQERAAKIEEARREWRAAPRLLRLELWWMRQRLRWTARPGFRLVVLVPTA
jgi:hypothetical protein